MFFDLSNQLNNMKNVKLINSDWTPYTIKSIDMFFDGASDSYIIYVACAPQNKILASLTKLTLNQIRFPKQFAQYSLSWSIGIQLNYHKQYEINVWETQNCADKIKTGMKVLVIVCSENGAIQIFKRYNKLYQMNVNEPLVSKMGKSLNKVTGAQIGIIENQFTRTIKYNRYNYTQTFVFISESQVPVTKSKSELD